MTRPIACFVPLLALVAGCFNVDPNSLGPTPFRCSKMYPDCPDGYICSYAVGQCLVTSNCVCICADPNNCPTGATSALKIPTSGPPYSGNHLDPGLATCHESDGNNGFQSAFVVGDSTGKFDGLEICPSGDVDVYSLNVDPGEYAKVVIGFQIEYGDLDLEVLDSKGNKVGIDNDATHHLNKVPYTACIQLPKGSASCPCTYYAIVDGAGGSVNRYWFQMTKSSIPPGTPGSPAACNAMPATPDLGGF
jgi:hypothetical protein